MKIIDKYQHTFKVTALILALSLLGLFGFIQHNADASHTNTQNQGAPTEGFLSYEFFSTPSTTVATVTGTTTTATSTGIAYFDPQGRLDTGNMLIRGADQVTFWFGRASSVGGNAGTSTFRIQVSDNGTDWLDYNKLVSNVNNTNAQEVTRVTTVALTGTSTAFASMDSQIDTFMFARCIVVEATDGTHFCRGSAKF